MKLNDDISVLKGIGGKTSALFNRVGVFSLWDLINYAPVRYEKYPEVSPELKASPGEEAAFFLTVLSDGVVLRARRLTILSCIAEDEKGNRIKIKWFNSGFLSKLIKKGLRKVFYGRLQNGREGIELIQPRVFGYDEYEEMKGVLLPIYPLTKGLTGKMISKAAEQVIDNVPIEDFLCEKDCAELKLLSLQDAFKGIHFPKDETEAGAAHKRIAFNEFLTLMVNIRRLRAENEKNENPYPLMESAAAKRVTEILPYELTPSQKKAYDDIVKDMSSDRTMNRLLQGDVGSGKTIVAFLSMIAAAENGYQAAIMAPTEVLAAQHANKLKALVEKAGLPFETVLLTGSLNAASKREAREAVSSGRASLIVGTHALIVDNVSFKNLALAVTDEQHRFGVRQREQLSGDDKIPHALVMSATPIPRTLAIILYGDLDISLMEGVPERRKPIKNCVVGTDYRNKAWSFIYDEVKKGRQAYVICPLVEESEALDCENVIDYAGKLKGAYGDRVRIGVLHGRLNSREKNEIMENFKAGFIDVLVSTTVVEVGVDVPNATVMMIENAERFGLSSLHQIRGRVGRGEEQGYCIFMDTSGNSAENKRLSILNSTNDGFKIADEDLKLRGAGDIFGVRQSGEMTFHSADIYKDADMLRLASSFSERMSRETLEKTGEYEKLEKRIVL